MSTTATTLRASINETAFIKNLRTLFSGSDSFLGELIQNARRASATKISFIHTEDNLVCQDDGEGVKDFSKLLTFAESGWDNEVTAKDNPFGMGVFSYFFAAEQVIFESQGQQINIVCSDLLNGGAAQLENVPFESGTRITFVGLKKTLHRDTLRDLVRGFSVPVFYNGEELPRPHALNSESFLKTDVGMMRVSLTNGSVSTYLQGLPVGVGYYYGDQAIHLDSQAFEAQMPDRHMLYNHDEAMCVINAAVRKERVRQLYEAKPKCSAKDFVRNYFHIAQSLRVEEVFNDVKVISSAQATVATACINDNDASFSTMDETQLENWLLITDVPHREDSHKAFMLHNLGLEHNVLKLDLHEEHWLHEKAMSFDDVNIELIAGETVQTSKIDGIDLKMVKTLAYKVTGPHGFEKTYPMSEFVLNVAEPGEADETYISPECDCEVLILEGCTSSPHLCIHNFESERGGFDEGSADESESEWVAALQKLNGMASFAKNILSSIRNNSAVAQEVGEMAAFQSTSNEWFPKHAVMNDEWFSKVAQAVDVDPAKLKAAIQSAFTD